MQTKPDYLDQLIERASQAVGSDYQLAKRIQTSRHTISDWKHGRRPCPAGDQTLMAEIAGLDPEAWTARAVISQYEGTPKGEMLKAALKKALLATGGVVASFGASAAQNLADSVGYLIRCILC